MSGTSRVTFKMFKIIGGVKAIDFELTAISEQNAKEVAYDFYNKNGLIGRYYCETSTGFNFSIQ